MINQPKDTSVGGFMRVFVSSKSMGTIPDNSLSKPGAEPHSVAVINCLGTNLNAFGLHNLQVVSAWQCSERMRAANK
jgi:hypothetical protein